MSIPLHHGHCLRNGADWCERGSVDVRPYAYTNAGDGFDQFNCPFFHHATRARFRYCRFKDAGPEDCEAQERHCSSDIRSGTFCGGMAVHAALSDIILHKLSAFGTAAMLRIR